VIHDVLSRAALGSGQPKPFIGDEGRNGHEIIPSRKLFLEGIISQQSFIVKKKCVDF